MKHISLGAGLIAVMALLTLTTGPPLTNEEGSSRFTGAAPIESIDANANCATNTGEATDARVSTNDAVNAATDDGESTATLNELGVVPNSSRLAAMNHVNPSEVAQRASGASTTGSDALALKFFRGNSTAKHVTPGSNVLNCPLPAPATVLTI